MPSGSQQRRTVPAPAVVPAKVRVPATDALPRERLEDLLEAVWRHRLSLIVAPAGSGKTTLLARFAALAGVPVAWYRAESWDADEPAARRHLEAALTNALPGVAGGWRDIEDAARALDAWRAGPAMLVIDDLHALEGTPAEGAIGRFIDYAPPWLSILAATRVTPGFNLSRLRVSGELLEIAAEDLRFRAWEVERLFRDFYRDPVPPAELAVLARRTEGWAAGLQLFHLATRGKTADERRRILSGVSSSSRLVREYLAHNVMAELPAELGDFLIETCVLGRLSGDLCDELLQRRGSGSLLEELARRQIFTVEVDEADGSYRYHEVLRTHLDRTLVDRIGEAAARERYARAGALLEAAGAPEEALGAYCRAEDWARVRKLLGGQGEQLAGKASGWLASLPPAIVRHEPWLELAAARLARAEGRWTDALEAYARAEAAFGTAPTSLICRRERLGLRAWLEPVAVPPSDWTRVLRAGLVREPLGVARETAAQPDVPGDLARGLLALAAGEVAQARRDLEAATEDDELGPVLAAAARLGAGVSALLAGDASGITSIDHAVEVAERAGAPWLARLGRTASRLAASAARTEDATAAGAAFEDGDDPWGAAIAALLEAWQPAPSAGENATPATDRRLVAAERAAIGFRRLGAGVLEAWARGVAALAHAEAGSPEARDAAIAAESLARATGTPGVRLLAYLAMAASDATRRSEYEELARTVRAETGMAEPPPADRPPAERPMPAGIAVGPGFAVAGGAGAGHGRSNGHATNGHASNGHANGDANGRPNPDPATLQADDGAGPVRIRAFGGFVIEAAGQPVSLDGVKPRARALLRLLALHAGSGVHREVIGDALWPDADAQTAARSLQVGISAIRGRLADALGEDGQGLVARDGEAYRLAVPAGSVDLRRFDAAIAEGRAARLRGEPAAAAFGRALELYRGDLLPEDGPEEWVVEPRERYRSEAVEAARSVAEAVLLAGDPRAAIDACGIGLAIDRYHDALWRLLIEARDRAGDVGAARRDRREYQGILAELGLPERPSVSA